jgi:hypothetical protein
MKPEQLEIARLKREVAKLKAERDIPNRSGRSVRSPAICTGLQIGSHSAGSRPS